MFYLLNDYNSMIEEKITTVLPDSVKMTIETIIKQLGISTQTFTTTKTNTQLYEAKKTRTTSRRSSYSEWETKRIFKPTVLVEKEGSEKIMSEIRVNLNKISAKNYETNRNIILGHIETITNTEEVEQIANTIFEIASTNKFFSEIYSKLYKELSEKYEIFNTILHNFLKGFILKLQNIQYVDPTGNYDEYCKYNKINDANKAISVFITNLVKNTVLETDQLLDLILEMQTYIFQMVLTPNKNNEIEEMTENLFLMITESSSFIKLSEKGEKIIENVKKMSEWKVKELPSISSRAIFKYKDIVDKLSNTVKK